MDETPLIEKVKNGNLQALLTPFPSGTSHLKKRKWNGFQESHKVSETGNSGKQKTPWRRSDQYDGETPQTFSNKQRAKKDELVMNIPNIPRRPRSFAKRFSSSQRCFAVPSSPPLSITSRLQNPNLTASNEVENGSPGMKSRLLKDFEITENVHISDEEVELAEVLFDLARSIPSAVPSASFNYEEGSRGSEKEAVSMGKAPIPLCGERKVNQQKTPTKVDESPCMHGAEKVSSSSAFCSSGRFHSAKHIQNCVSAKNDFNQTGGKGELKFTERKLVERIPNQGCLSMSSLSVDKSEVCGQVFGNSGADCSGYSSRKHDAESSNVSSKQDPGCPPNLSPENDAKVDQKRLSLSESSSNVTIGDCDEKHFINTEKVYSKEITKGLRGYDEWKLYSKNLSNQDHELCEKEAIKEEHMDLKLSGVKDVLMMPDLNGGRKLCSVSSGAGRSNERIGALSEFGSNGTGFPSCRDSPYLGSSLQQAMQCLHAKGIERATQRPKGCATHVYIARFIWQQQQFTRVNCTPRFKPLSPATLGGDELRNNTLHSLQVESGLTSLESSARGIAGTRSKPSNLQNRKVLAGSEHSLSAVDNVMSESLGDLKNLVARAQDRHVVMQFGPGRVFMPSNSAPAQKSVLLNKSVFNAQPVPENLLRVPSQLLKYQQAKIESYVGLSSRLANHQMQFQQAQCEQHLCLTSSHLHGGRSHTILEGNRIGSR
ncbi:hypothetical protein KP509_16G048500 [Ceratopteris richardii]|nr:hypothetical protein KP509_16G048500 [Ceratopteris richardii]